MRYYEVSLTQSSKGLPTTLVYQHNSDLKSGQITKVSVRGKKEIAVVLKKVSKPDFKTKDIEIIYDDLVLPRQLMKLAKWMSRYYLSPSGSVFRTMLPTGIDKKRRPKDFSKLSDPVKRSHEHPLSASQKKVIKKADQKSDTTLITGVTGSGKTRIYLELTQKQIENDKSVIILVPEISLTSQIVSDFKSRFANVLVTHSSMTESERHQIWLATLFSKTPLVIIGPRSALFSPLKNLGMIVIDEAHDDAYRQDTTPRYNTLKVARVLANYFDGKLVLGSATPNIEDYHRANQSGLNIDIKKSFAKSKTKVKLTEIPSHGSGILGKDFIAGIRSALRNNQQSLVFHNRRGTSPMVICSNCSWTMKCNKCHIPMVLHEDVGKLICHSCRLNKNLPKSCPDCRNVDIVYKGIGTKKVVSEIQKLFPEAVVARFDTDNPKSDSLATKYKELHDGKIDIIVGTQMIAKGLDLPRLSFGGVVNADVGLNMPDYRASERVFQLLNQVIGRVGRHTQDNLVIIQTYNPKNPVIRMAASQDYQKFYEWSIKERKNGSYPPFSHMLLLTNSYSSRSKAQKSAQQAADKLRVIEDLIIKGPAPAFYERRSNQYRWQLLIKSKSRKNLIDASELFLSNPKWAVNLDPSGLL